MSELANFKSNLDLSGRRKTLILVSISYAVLVCLLFFSLFEFYRSYLAGLIVSQNYSMSVQEWRQVANGILGGWTFSPSIQSLCIFSKEALLYGLNDCNHPVPVLSGLSLSAEVSSFYISASLTYSLWFLACGLPLVAIGIVFGLYTILKRPLNRKFESDILNFLGTFDQNQKDLSTFQIALRKQTSELLQLREQAAIAHLAAQVAHDIRSPVSALNIVMATSPELSQERRQLAQSALTRIQEISDDLMTSYRTNAKRQPLAMTATPILPLIESSIEEKRLIIQNRPETKIVFTSQSGLDQCTTTVSPADMKRVISNLLNNAIESLVGGRGCVEVKLGIELQFITLDIIDNGKGIPKSVLPKLSFRGVSAGKEGTGLGLYHARTTIEPAGGQLVISSVEGEGTHVRLLLPQ